MFAKIAFGVLMLIFCGTIAVAAVMGLLELRYQSELMVKFIEEFRIHFDDAFVRRIMRKLGMNRFH